MIQIAHLFVWFAQMITAVICMGIALVVCATDEKPSRETATEFEETPAQKDEIPAKKTDAPAEEPTEEECLNTCKKELKVCLEPCDSVVFSSICNGRCIYLKYFCKGLCAMP